MALKTTHNKVLKVLKTQASFTPEAMNKISEIEARWNLVRTRPKSGVRQGGVLDPLSLEGRGLG